MGQLSRIKYYGPKNRETVSIVYDRFSKHLLHKQKMFTELIGW